MWGGGANDASLNVLIQAYNEKVLTRNRLADNSSEENSVVQELNAELAGMRGSINGTLASNIKALQLKLAQSKDVQGRAVSNIQAIPEQEKYALDVSRQQAIKETLYTYLLNKREETALQLAITEANIRVVEAPFGSRQPIAPLGTRIYLIALAVGCALPVAIFWLFNFLNTGIRGRKDIEQYTTLSVLGEIPSIPRSKEKKIDRTRIVVSDTHNDLLSEAFRILRTNFEFADRKAQVYLFTSTMPGEGKSFVSRNLSVAIALRGKRVVLVDTDMRKGTLSRDLGIKRKEGLSTYLSGMTDSVDGLIQSQLIDNRVDVISSGVTPPNPSELLMNDRLEVLINELRKRYDYILLDNVPALMIADAGIVNRVTDITLYVIREGVMDRRYLPELQRIHEEKKFNNMYVILNGSSLNRKRYGYGYGYGYVYGYGYGYGYGESKSEGSAEKKSFWGRRFSKG